MGEHLNAIEIVNSLINDENPTLHKAAIPNHGRGYLLPDQVFYVGDIDDPKHACVEIAAHINYVIEKLSNVCIFFVFC